MTDALILAGAVSQGAFTAGALAELLAPETQARLGLDVRRVVAASSGAVNGAFLCSHLHAGSEAAGIPLLEEFWIELGDFRGVFDVSLRALGRARGISTSAKVRALLEKFIPPRAGTRPIELAVVVTNLDGEVDLVGSELATTFERCLRFSGSDFASEEALAKVFDTVIASAAFPVVFEPVTITIGARTVRCVDGGVCNDTPVKYALGNGADIDPIFIVTPIPSVSAGLQARRRRAPLSARRHARAGEVVPRPERGVRRQPGLRALERALPISSLRERALAALGWSGRRVLDIVEIRPRETLKGDAFAGFFSRRLRADYVRAGRDAAREAVGRL